ncbi:MAG TPA: zinc ribbon domain-containing protein, partial [Anaerovoracaceae bacterium]|nr:zinc ribbon domain-containing protein [Anaerovoracaceae bacterium]
GICGTCGKGITLNRKTEKMKHSHYKCYNRGGFDANRNPIPKCERCYKPIKAEELDSNIIEKLKEFFNSKDIIEDIINRDKRSRKNMYDEIENEIKSLEKQQIKVEREIESITNLVIDNLTNNPNLIGHYIKKQEQLVSQLDGIARQITKLKVIPIERTDDDYSKDELLASVDSFAELFDYVTEAEKKILVHYLVNKVTVESVDKFKIELRFFEEFPAGTYLRELQNSGDTPQGIRIVKQ